MSVLNLDLKKVEEKFEKIRGDLEKYSAKMDEENRIPEELLATLRSEKIFGLMIPEKYGGLGYSIAEAAVFSRFIGRYSPALALSIMVNSQVAELLYDNETYFEDYLKKIASGEFIGGLGITEVGGGSDINRIKTVFKINDDKAIVNGEKSFLTNGLYADVFALLGKTSENEFVLGIVPKTSGVEIVRTLDLVGMRGAGVAIVRFDNVEIPKKNIVYLGKTALVKTLEIINRGRIFTAASSVGVVEALLDNIISWVQEREVFGKKLSDNDYIQQVVGDIASDIESVWATVLLAGLRMDKGLDARNLISVAKLNGAKVAMRAAVISMQILASHGYIRGSLVDRLYRDAKALEIMEGTNEVQRMNIFKQLLRSHKKGKHLISIDY